MNNKIYCTVCTLWAKSKGEHYILDAYLITSCNGYDKQLLKASNLNCRYSFILFFITIFNLLN